MYKIPPIFVKFAFSRSIFVILFLPILTMMYHALHTGRPWSSDVSEKGEDEGAVVDGDRDGGSL